MSIIQNIITLNSQVDNMSYSRRFKAEVSNGIGQFMDCLDILTKFSVMTNCLIIFFTSAKFREVFTKGTTESITDWDLTKFLIVVIIIEHVLMVIQILLSIMIDDKPEFVKSGER